MISPYRTALGQGYDRMAAPLRDFHNEESLWRGQATFRITRGKGLLRNLVAWLGGLPPAGDQVPVQLTCTRETQKGRVVEVWDRDFNGFRMGSKQWAANGIIFERFGWITLAFRLQTTPDALKLEVIKAWVAGIRIPSFLSPKGTGLEVALPDGTIQVRATASAPLLGQIVCYEGPLKKVQ